MKKLFAIVGREWRAYFLSPLAYVILTAYMFLNGLIFSRIVAFLSVPGGPRERFLSLLFTNTFFWIFTLFIVPILTMRLLAEERRSGTLEVLLTSPVSEAAVVVGKFLGALGFFLVLWLPSLAFILYIRSKTDVDLGSVAAGYLGIALLGAYFLSIGTFASAVTKNQILAAILAFAMLIPIFSVGLFESGADPARQSLIGYLNIWDHMDEFARGVVDTRRLVYYLSGTAFFLLLAATVLSSKKETP
ncbi:MAG TPA: ABC transporter permease [Thermoanaerobaculia bacterium]|nr:ABC transporter permease [Thermoanaerobaculia bacterium]